MKRILYVRGPALAAAVLLLPMIAGCATSSLDSGQIFFNIIWTALLGVTAAGGVVLLRNA